MSSINKYSQELKRRFLFGDCIYHYAGYSNYSAKLMPPEWTTRLILIFGFPIAMIFAWIYDRSPEVFIKTDYIAPDQHTITENGLPKDANGNSAIVYIDFFDYSK